MPHPDTTQPDPSSDLNVWKSPGYYAGGGERAPELDKWPENMYWRWESVQTIKAAVLASLAGHNNSRHP